MIGTELPVNGMAAAIVVLAFTTMLTVSVNNEHDVKTCKRSKGEIYAALSLCDHRWRDGCCGGH
jgi:hypothetical protein